MINYPGQHCYVLGRRDGSVFLMPALPRVTWHNNFEVSLLLVSSDSVTSEELIRKVSLSSNQSTTIKVPCCFTMCGLKPVIIDSLRNQDSR